MRKDLIAAIPVSIGVGMAGGVFGGEDLPNALVAGVAVTAIVIWTGAAGFVGVLIQQHGEAERLDVALDIRREGERRRLALELADQRARLQALYAADTEALNDAVKEDPR